MTPYITILPFLLLLNGIDGSIWLNEKLVKIQSKNPGETDLNAIKVANPRNLFNLTITHTAILNANYATLKKFGNLTSFYLTDVTGAPRITKDLFQNLPNLAAFVLRAKENYNEVEFEEDALYYAKKLKYFIVERLYTVSALSSRFLGSNSTNLKKLALDNSAVSIIEANAFDFANNLDYLSISGQASIKIEKGAFKKLTKLEQLYLDLDIQDFSWDNFGLLPSVNILTLSNVNPKKIDGNEIKKYFPKLMYLMVFTDNCQRYEKVPTISNELLILIVNNNSQPCFKLPPKIIPLI